MSIEHGAPTQEVREKKRFGANVTMVVDLMRHPEKDYATGNLTEAGKAALVKKLDEEYSDQDFDTVKGYVSPHKRAQQAMEPLSQFLEENDIDTSTRTKKVLFGSLGAKYTTKTDKALDKILEERGQVSETGVEKKDAVEPVSKDSEKAKNELLIQEFFDKEFPMTDLKGEDVGKELDELMQHFAQMAKRFYSESKVKIIAISHGGIIEYLTKLIYLKNHPEVKSSDVSAEQIGGLLTYMEGPRITIKSDESGKQTGTLEFKELNLDFPIEG